MIYWLIILLMVLLSAFFSASEIAFNASNKMRLKKLADEGNKTAKLAYKISEDFTTALSAILIGNNLANIAASTAATVIAMEWFLSLQANGFEFGGDGTASVIATIGMTIIILIFGEIVPKILSKKNADTFVLFFAYPIRILTWILYPLVFIVMGLVSLLKKIWGKDNDDMPTVTEDELSSIIETVEEEGVIDEDKSELLQSTLEFRDTTVEEIMKPRMDVISLDITDDLSELEEVINQSRYSRIPVYEDSIDNIIGILFLNHYYKEKTGEGEMTVEKIRSLLMKPLFLHKTVRLEVALSKMQAQKMHLAIVVDEFGGTMGIVTMEDILEELVGEIWDEMDEIITPCKKISEDTYEVSGDMNIEDFFAEIEFEPKDFECEYSTVGGFAIEKLDGDPHENDTFEFSDKSPDEEEKEDDEEENKHTILSVTVKEMDDMRIVKLLVKVTRPPLDEEE